MKRLVSIGTADDGATTLRRYVSLGVERICTHAGSYETLSPDSVALYWLSGAPQDRCSAPQRRSKLWDALFT